MDTKKIARDLYALLLRECSGLIREEATAIVFGKKAHSDACLLELFDIKAHDELVLRTLAAEEPRYRDGERVQIMGRKCVIYETRGTRYRVQWDSDTSPDDRWIDEPWIQPVIFEDAAIPPLEAATGGFLDEVSLIPTMPPREFDEGARVFHGERAGVVDAVKTSQREWVYMVRYLDGETPPCWISGTALRGRFAHPFALLTEQERAEGWYINGTGRIPVDGDVVVACVREDGEKLPIGYANSWYWGHSKEGDIPRIRLWRVVERAEAPLAPAPLTDDERAEGWNLNMGAAPFLGLGERLDVMLVNGRTHLNVKGDIWRWDVDGSLKEVTIRAWRPAQR